MPFLTFSNINVFLFDLAMKLPKNTGINKYAIELKNGKQPTYRSFYSLRPVELEILKTYIKTHLKTGFIQPFKSLACAFILFNKKAESSLCLCVNYWDLITSQSKIDIHYPLSLNY